MMLTNVRRLGISEALAATLRHSNDKIDHDDPSTVLSQRPSPFQQHQS